MKKLIPALCMLLVAASMLGASTYAWFTMNRNVSATGMTVKAKGEGGILIDRTIYGPNWTSDQKKELSSSVTFGSSTVQSLLPTSTYNCVDWYHAEAEADDESTAKSGTYTVISSTPAWVSTDVPTTAQCGFGETVSDGEKNYYYMYDNVTILPNNASISFNKLWITRCSVEATNGDPSQELSKSLRVAVKCGDKVVILAPVADATLGYTVYNDGTHGKPVTAIDSSASATTKLASSYAEATADGSNLLLSNGDNLTKLDVSIYVFFEGEDQNHTTDNYSTAAATTVENLTISVSFQCEKVNA